MTIEGKYIILAVPRGRELSNGWEMAQQLDMAHSLVT